MAGISDDGLESRRPNVVLIMCDQFRGDCLGFDGHPDVKTPYLDTLAAQGTYFENAHAACPSCSRAPCPQPTVALAIRMASPGATST